MSEDPRDTLSESVSLDRRVLESVVNYPARSILGLVVLLLLIGTVFYHFVEGWGWLDSVYFCVITLTTIGYGDFSPQTDPGKLFTIGYAFAGVGLLAGYLQLRAQKAVRRQTLRAIKHSHDKEIAEAPAPGERRERQDEAVSHSETQAALNRTSKQ